jgi:hypothetical protein
MQIFYFFEWQPWPFANGARAREREIEKSKADKIGCKLFVGVGGCANWPEGLFNSPLF